jgi:hypothetical protein
MLARQVAALDNRAMTDGQAPTMFRPGDVTYLHIPCREPLRAADFYEAVFAHRSSRPLRTEPGFLGVAERSTCGARWAQTAGNPGEAHLPQACGI